MANCLGSWTESFRRSTFVNFRPTGLTCTGVIDFIQVDSRNNVVAFGTDATHSWDDWEETWDTLEGATVSIGGLEPFVIPAFSGIQTAALRSSLPWFRTGSGNSRSIRHTVAVSNLPMTLSIAGAPDPAPDCAAKLTVALPMGTLPDGAPPGANLLLELPESAAESAEALGAALREVSAVVAGGVRLPVLSVLSVEAVGGCG